jgi:two-component system, NtrC family, response regulator HydG
MTDNIVNKIRSFRLPIDSKDHVRLKVSRLDDTYFKTSAPIADSSLNLEYWFKVQNISLTGLSYFTNVQLSKYQIGDDLKLSLSFEDFHISVKGKILRMSKQQDHNFIAIQYIFEEGQSFDLFFQKFIKTFDHLRIKNQLFELLKDQQNSSYEYLSTMDLLLNLNKEVEEYTEVDRFHHALLKQWKINLHSDEILSFKLDNISSEKLSTNVISFEYQDKMHSLVIENSVLNNCLNNKTTFTAFIFNDESIAQINNICSINLSNILCSPIVENNKVIGILLLNRNNKEKYSSADQKIIQQACLQLGTSFSKKEKRKKENVKYLNPRKPRQYALVGNDDKIQNLRRLIAGTKNDNKPIVLTGSPGTGKTLLAQIIHAESRCSNLDFLYLDADRQNHLEKIKKLISSNKLPLEFNSFGTIYIHNSSRLNGQDFRKLYSNVLEGFNEVRIILSPGDNAVPLNECLPKEVLKKVGNNKLHLPNLNERMQDIPLLVNFLVKLECKKRGYLEKSIDEAVIKQFEKHNWTGNIREIKTSVSRLVEYFSHKNHIVKLPPDSYHIFSVNKNTDYLQNEKSIKIINAINKHKYTKTELSLLFQREVILIELDKNHGSLKKAALSLGKPLEFIEHQLESSSDLLAVKVTLR